MRFRDCEENPMSFTARRHTIALAATATLALLLSPNTALAQSKWPSQEIRLISPFAAGGTIDGVSKVLALELARQLGVPVTVENKPGAGGVNATAEVVKSAPDGHTLVLTHVGTLAVNPFVMSNPPYRVNRDLVPVTLVAKIPNVFVVHPHVPAADFKEFLAYAKTKPGKLDYGSAGNASASHFAMERLKAATGLYITHLPYRSAGSQMSELLAGRTQAASLGVNAAVGGHIRSGKLRALAVGTAERLPALPDVPTVAELGFKHFESTQWYGLHAPAKTPASTVQRLQQEVQKALRSPAVQARLAQDNSIAGGMSSKDFDEFIRKEQAIWQDIVARARIKTQ
jgi:tripartite-type tricarboxylate transporter receptor subunit TctC